MTDMLLYTVIVMTALAIVSISEMKISAENDGIDSKDRKSRELQQQVATQAADLDKANRKLAEKELELDRLNHQIASLERRMEAYLETVRSSERAKEDNDQSLRQVRQELREEKDRLSLANLELEKLRNEAAYAESDRKKINRELIGLKGELKRTAILIDASGSMAGQRWIDAVNVMEIWLEQLPMSEAFLVVFNHACAELPQKGQGFFDLSGRESKANRKRMIDYLRGITPVGGTFTRGALELTYMDPDRPVDTIILFTDGAPNTGLEATIVPAEAEAIYRLVEANSGVVINAIGVGNYFEKDLSEFLMKIAQISKGTFLGR